MKKLLYCLLLILLVNNVTNLCAEAENSVLSSLGDTLKSLATAAKEAVSAAQDAVEKGKKAAQEAINAVQGAADSAKGTTKAAQEEIEARKKAAEQVLQKEKNKINTQSRDIQQNQDSQGLLSKDLLNQIIQAVMNALGLSKEQK